MANTQMCFTITKPRSIKVIEHPLHAHIRAAKLIPQINGDVHGAIFPAEAMGVLFAYRLLAQV